MGYKHDVLSHRQQITVEKRGVNVYFTDPSSFGLQLYLLQLSRLSAWSKAAKQQSAL